MSWFGGGLSNLQGKISTLTAQVLNDVAESVQGKSQISLIVKVSRFRTNNDTSSICNV